AARLFLEGAPAELGVDRRHHEPALAGKELLAQVVERGGKAGRKGRIPQRGTGPLGEIEVPSLPKGIAAAVGQQDLDLQLALLPMYAAAQLDRVPRVASLIRRKMHGCFSYRRRGRQQAALAQRLHFDGDVGEPPLSLR